MEQSRDVRLLSERMSAEQQFREFIRSIFLPKDLVEIRGIESPPRNSKMRGKVVLREWLTADELTDEFAKLQELNEEGANIYFGVNPRAYRSGKKRSVQTCRTLWADLDHCKLADLPEVLKNGIPKPSIIVNSGHGIHLYWKLDRSLSIRTVEDRSKVESLLTRLYRDLDSDSTQDVTRLLRLPGLANVKNEPVLCCLERHSATLSHSISAFEHWQAPPNEKKSKKARRVDTAQGLHVVKHQSRQLDTTGYRIEATKDMTRIRGLIASLDEEAEDRSRRDFRVVCELIRLGLSTDDIESLVYGKSKFGTDDYIRRTVRNAFRAVKAESSK